MTDIDLQTVSDLPTPPTLTYIVEFRQHDRRWIVRRNDVDRVSFVYSSKSDAEHRARTTAARLRCDVIVLAADGTVERRYTNDARRRRSSVFREPRRSR